MRIESTKLDDVLVITPDKHADARGFFSETFRADKLKLAGFDRAFVQDNHSYTEKAGVIRGIHFQTPPHAQDKLIRVVRGAILDVAVDLRKASGTYGQWVSVELSAANWKQLLVPAGFGHGFCTLEPDTEIAYKTSAIYAPDHDAGLIWNDPDLAISWPVVQQPVVSEKDACLPAFADFQSPF